MIDEDKELLDNFSHQSDSIVDEKVDFESQQKKIESEINEILRDIDITFELIEPEINKININEIEVNGVEYVSPQSNDFSENNNSKNEISFDLFSSHNDINNNNVEQEIIKSNIEFENHHNFEKEDVTDSTNIEEHHIEFIKLDLNDEVSEDYEINEKIQVNEDNFDIETEEAINLFEKPIDTDIDNENLIRKENLKQYNLSLIHI